MLIAPIYSLVCCSLVFAEDPSSQPSDGYKNVPVHVGNKTVPFRVKETTDPYKNVSSANSTGKYDPTRIFSGTSSLAGKKFSPSSDVIPHERFDLKSLNQDSFPTKAYSDPALSTASNLNSKATISSAHGYNRNATGFNNSYAIAEAKGLGNSATLNSARNYASDYQNRKAVLGPDKPEIILAANTLGHKQYLGPGAQHVPSGLEIKDNIVLSRMSDVPNRPLTIDEVRNLINHGTKPDTTAKPEEPSKPLNDPNYKPEPLRESPAITAPPTEDDKSDLVPPPGTMAAPQPPENSDPLPQP